MSLASLILLLPRLAPAAELSAPETTALIAKLQEHRAKFPSLTADFIAHNFDLQHLMRTTVTARTRAGDPGVWDWPGVQDAGTGNGELRLSVDRDHLDALRRIECERHGRQLAVAPKPCATSTIDV